MDTNTSDVSCISSGSSSVPRSAVFFEATTTAEKVIMVLCTLLTAAILVDYATTFLYVLRTYRTSSDIKTTSLQVIGIYPIVALASLLSLWVPRAALVSDLMRSLIIASCMFEFTSLMTHYYGGKTEQQHLLQNSKMTLHSPPCACCCLCLPTVPATEKNLKRLKRGVLQAYILQPPLILLSLVLWLDGEYTPGALEADDAFIYLVLIQMVSTITAVHCVFIFFNLCRADLQPFRLEKKFFALQGVVFFVDLQGLIFDILIVIGEPASRGILSTEVLGKAYEQMLLIFEMSLMTLVARHAYRQPHEVVADMMAIEQETVEQTCKFDDGVEDINKNGHLGSTVLP